MWKYRLPKRVREGKSYIIRRYNPRKHAFEFVEVEVVEIKENETFNDTPGATVIYLRDVKKHK